MPEITNDYLEPGAVWTFIHSSGRETEYVYERLMTGGVHVLLNPKTGKCAQVSKKWLCETQVNGRSYWLPKTSARAQAA